LIYVSRGLGYLKCEKCGGYYELQEGKSPEDFDVKCNCSGKLDHYYSFDDNYGENIEVPREMISAEKVILKKWDYLI
jgi:hypothetical protein